MLPKCSVASLARFHNAGPVRIDPDHPGQSTLIGQNDVNLDSHPNSQRDGSRYPCSMKVNDEGLAFTGQRVSKALGLDPNLQLNPCASSQFTSTVLGSHLCHLPLRRWRKSFRRNGATQALPRVAACPSSMPLSIQNPARQVNERLSCVADRHNQIAASIPTVIPQGLSERFAPCF